MQIDAVREVAGKDAQVFAISSAAHQGVPELLRALVKVVQQAREVIADIETEDDDDLPVISLSQQAKAEAWTIRYDEEDDVYVVTGDKIEKFARRTQFTSYETVNRLRDIMKKMGISHELTRKGATGESKIRIGNDEFTLLEQIESDEES